MKLGQKKSSVMHFSKKGEFFTNDIFYPYCYGNTKETKNS